jgi:hypothetical protein
MIFNDKPNYQVARILMNPRPFFSNRSENGFIYNTRSSFIIKNQKARMNELRKTLKKRKGFNLNL